MLREASETRWTPRSEKPAPQTSLTATLPIGREAFTRGSGKEKTHSPGRAGLRQLGITIIRGFRKTRTTTAYVVIANTSALWKKCGGTGNSISGRLGCRNVR